ncbi:hypothetical protein Efla_003075 [Eimeria flavescens]
MWRKSSSVPAPAGYKTSSIDGAPFKAISSGPAAACYSNRLASPNPWKASDGYGPNRPINGRRQIRYCSFALLFLLGAAVIPSQADYVFDEAEVASTADNELPLPRPFDATACGFHHLAQQQLLLEAMQPLSTSAAQYMVQSELLRALAEAQQAKLVVEEAVRLIEFGRQAKVTVRLTLRSTAVTAVPLFYFLLPFSEATQLGWLTVTAADGTPLRVEPVPALLPRISELQPNDWQETRLLVENVERRLAAASEGGGSFESACRPQLFKVHLAHLPELREKETAKISVIYLLGRPYRPVPRAVELEVIQSVIFATSANWPVPYRTLRSSVTLRLPPLTSLGEAGERRLLEKSFQKASVQLWTWESGEEIEPLRIKHPFAVVFPLPMHLGYVVSMERLLVAPLSGSIAHEDLFKIHNDAALLKGAFNPTTVAQLQSLPPGVSRLAGKWSAPHGKPVPTHVLFDVRASLPPDVFDLDVSDLAGNLTSTFAAREGPADQPLSTQLEVWPRYPVLGGWNFDLHLKYKVPMKSLVTERPDSLTRSLLISLEPPLQELLVENASLTVTLPLGAENVRYVSSIAFDSVQRISMRWWFDVFARRPALRLRWHSVSVPPAEFEKRIIVVNYDYPYIIDLEWLNILFLLLIFGTVVLTGVRLWSLRLQIQTPEEEMAVKLLSRRKSASGKQRDVIEAAVNAGNFGVTSRPPFSGCCCLCLRKDEYVAAVMQRAEARDGGQPKKLTEKVVHSRSALLTTLVAARLLRASTPTDVGGIVMPGFAEAVSSYCDAIEKLANAYRDKLQGAELQEGQRLVDLARHDLQELAAACKAHSSKEHEA